MGVRRPGAHRPAPRCGVREQEEQEGAQRADAERGGRETAAVRNAVRRRHHRDRSRRRRRAARRRQAGSRRCGRGVPGARDALPAVDDDGESCDARLREDECPRRRDAQGCAASRPRDRAADVPDVRRGDVYRGDARRAVTPGALHEGVLREGERVRQEGGRGQGRQSHPDRRRYEPLSHERRHPGERHARRQGHQRRRYRRRPRGQRQRHRRQRWDHHRLGGRASRLDDGLGDRLDSRRDVAGVCRCAHAGRLRDGGGVAGARDPHRYRDVARETDRHTGVRERGRCDVSAAPVPVPDDRSRPGRKLRDAVRLGSFVAVPIPVPRQCLIRLDRRLLLTRCRNIIGIIIGGITAFFRSRRRGRRGCRRGRSRRGRRDRRSGCGGGIRLGRGRCRRGGRRCHGRGRWCRRCRYRRWYRGRNRRYHRHLRDGCRLDGKYVGCRRNRLDGRQRIGCHSCRDRSRIGQLRATVVG
jgi:hypothetical protein